MIPLIAALASGVCVFVGPEDGPGNVLFVQNGAPPTGPPELVNIQLLDLDHAQRTRLFELRADRPRLRDDLPEGTRIELPAGAGSLYAYRRDPGGPQRFGFFHVAADGTPTPLFERPASNGQSPFVLPVAVAADGAAFLVATTTAAGGDLFEVDVATGAAVNRTAAWPALEFHGDGLLLSNAWGAAAAKTALLRFDRSSPAAQATWVPTGSPVVGSATLSAQAQQAPMWYSGRLVASRGGDWAMTTAGRSAQRAHVFVFGPTGPAQRATSQPQHVSPPGFQPLYEDGPFWAIADDGSRVAWRVETPGSRELYLQRLAPTTASAPIHVSQDANFNPFLDEIGQFLFGALNELFVVMGDQTGQPFSIATGDLYGVQLGANGQTLLRNVTGTSGDLVPPFGAYGMIEPRGVWWLPTPGRFLIADAYGQGSLRGVNPVTGGVALLAYPAPVPDRVEHVGDRVLVAVELTNGTNEETHLWSLPDHAGVAAETLYTIPVDIDTARLATGADGSVSLVDSDVEDVGTLLRIDLATGIVEVVASPSVWGPTLDVGPGGETFAGLGDEDSPTQFFAWPPNTSATAVFAPGAPGFVLPGD